MRDSAVPVDERGSHDFASEASYIRALTESLEYQLAVAAQNAAKASERSHDVVLLRQAMLSLATAYDNHLATLAQRVEKCYLTLKRQSGDGNSMRVLGDSLANLRAVQTLIRSEKELLRERGLKRLQDYYDLSVGETVVIVDESSAWNGIMGRVASSKSLPSAQRHALATIDVVVHVGVPAWWGDLKLLSDSALDEDLSLEVKPVVFQRYQLAVWDFASIWEDDNDIKNVGDSKRNLSSLLTKLRKLPTTSSTTRATLVSSPSSKSTFSSSRERKSAKRKGRVKK